MATTREAFRLERETRRKKIKEVKESIPADRQ